MGWATVAVYALAALLAAFVARAAPFPARSRGRERAFWGLMALALACLAVNKELDLQSFLTALGRCMANAQGWYEERQAVQIGFVLALVAATGAAFALLLALLRGTWRRSLLPLLGLAFVSGFVLVRAVGFHRVDRLIGLELLSVRANWVLELAGPLLISAVALWLLVAGRQRRRAPA